MRLSSWVKIHLNAEVDDDYTTFELGPDLDHATYAAKSFFVPGA